MTDLRGDGINSIEDDAGSVTETTADEPPAESRAAVPELDRMSRRLGDRIRKVRKTRILKLIGLLLVLGSGTDRLGIFPTPASDADAARDPFAAIRLPVSVTAVLMSP